MRQAGVIQEFQPKKITPHEHLVTLPFFSVSPPEGVYAARMSPSASPNIAKTRTRRRRAPRRVWRDFGDFRRPDGTVVSDDIRKRPFPTAPTRTGRTGARKIAKIAPDAARRPMTPCASFQSV